MNYLKDRVNEGWSIQIYGRDRRLLFSFYPSHCWTFCAGFCLGFLLTVIMVGQQATTASTPAVDSLPSPNPHEPLLQVD
mgnify:FL=1